MEKGKKHTFLMPVIYSTTRMWGVVNMNADMEERARDLALYIIEEEATVRAAAKKFGISKSTVHKDLTERLPMVDRSQYEKVRAILDKNKAERHLRGGEATRQKYKREEQERGGLVG